MSTRVNVDQADVLLAIEKSLLGTVLQDGYQLTPKNCFITAYDDPQRAPDIIFVTIAMGDGNFPQGLQVGGGLIQCTEEFEVAVTIWSRHPANQVGHDAAGLVDKSRGVLRIKNRLLRALVVNDIGVNYPACTPGVNQFLRDLITGTRCSRPVIGTFGQDSSPITSMTIYFRVAFDHDLTS